MSVALQESRLQAEKAEQVASNLQNRVAQLEEWSTSQQPNMDDYVHRDKVRSVCDVRWPEREKLIGGMQVEEMELLFMDTIEKLSERVCLLEQDGER